MIVYEVTHILTFNTVDFIRYAPIGIVAVGSGNRVNRVKT